MNAARRLHVGTSRKPGPTAIFPLILSSLFNGVTAIRRGDAGPKHHPVGLDRAADSDGLYVRAGLMIQRQTKASAGSRAARAAEGRLRQISIINVEIALEVLRRLLVSAVFHHVEFTAPGLISRAPFFKAASC